MRQSAHSKLSVIIDELMSERKEQEIFCVSSSSLLRIFLQDTCCLTTCSSRENSPYFVTFVQLLIFMKDLQNVFTQDLLSSQPCFTIVKIKAFQSY